MKAEKEYIIWGQTEGSDDDQILYTKSKSYQEAEKIMGILAKDYGAKKMRIQVIDLSASMDLERLFSKTIA